MPVSAQRGFTHPSVSSVSSMGKAKSPAFTPVSVCQLDRSSGVAGGLPESLRLPKPLGGGRAAVWAALDSQVTVTRCDLSPNGLGSLGGGSQRQRPVIEG